MVQANAPIPLIQTAFEEAESLWEEGVMASLQQEDVRRDEESHKGRMTFSAFQLKLKIC